MPVAAGKPLHDGAKNRNSLSIAHWVLRAQIILHYHRTTSGRDICKLGH